MPRKLHAPLAILATVLVAATTAGWAQDAAAPAPETKAHSTPKKRSKPLPPPAPLVPTPQSGPGAFDASQRLVNLTEKLNLSPEQQAKMKPVLEDTETKVREARATAANPSAARDKVKAILESADIRMQVILDGAQKEQWEKLKKDAIDQTHVPFMDAGTMPGRPE